MAKRGLLGFDVTDTAREKPKGGAFLWTVVLLILTGMAMASWIGSFYIVAHPENPRCYRILKKLKRLDPPRQFQVTDEGPPKKFIPAPVGKFLTPKTALDFYGRMGPKELGQKNAELLRMYVKNYGESKTPVSYMTGVFEVVEAHALTGSDFFPSGVVAVTQARDYPQVLMEMVFPANQASVKTILGILPVGREITLERSKDLAAILHVDRMADSRLQFTTVPLSYGSFQLKDGRGSFTLKSPKDLEDPDKGGSPNNGLRIEAPLPIVDGIRLQKGLNAHAEYRRKVMAGNETERPKSDPLVAARSTDAAKDPQEIATPVVLREAPVQTPPRAPVPNVQVPKPPVSRNTSIIQSPTPKPALITSSPPTQLPERFPLPPRPVVRATPGPVAPAEVVKPDAPTPEPEPPKPVVISRPPVAPPVAAEAPPATPKKRLLSTKEASALVDNFDPAAGSTLGGEFVVTAVLDQRVALRASESLRDRDADPTQPGSSGAMIVVDFPKGVAPPAKDSTFSRNGERGFVIKSIRRTGNGQITILAEESAKP